MEVGALVKRQGGPLYYSVTLVVAGRDSGT